MRLREVEIAKVPFLNGCHCGLDPQSMEPNSWMPGQARHDNGTSAISVSLSESAPKMACAQAIFRSLGGTNRITCQLDNVGIS
jgi:hypothetical protein